jgi:mRNA interferase MazF
LTSAKARPALILASLTRGDIILCQITSQIGSHPISIKMISSDFVAGGLPQESFALAHRIVTANEVSVPRSVGRLKTAKLSEIRDAVCAIIQQS